MGQIERRLGRVPKISNFRAKVSRDGTHQVIIDQTLEPVKHNPGRRFGIASIGIAVVARYVLGEIAQRQLLVANVDQSPATCQIPTQIVGQSLGQIALDATAEVKTQRVKDSEGEA